MKSLQVIVLALCLFQQVGARAEDPPAPVDTTSDPWFQFMKWPYQFAHYDLGTQIMLGSVVVSFTAYTVWRSVREKATTARTKAESLREEQEEFENRKTALDAEIARWEKIENLANRFIADLKEYSDQRDKIPPGDRAQWLKSDEGKRWRRMVRSRTMVLYREVTKRYDGVMDKAHDLNPSTKPYVPTAAQPHRMTEDEMVHRDIIAAHEGHLHDMAQQINQVKRECIANMQKFGRTVPSAEAKARSATRVERISGGLTVAGGVTAGGMFIYKGDPIKKAAQVSTHNTQQTIAKSALCSQCDTDEGRAALEPAFQIIKKVLQNPENRSKLVASLNEKLLSSGKAFLTEGKVKHSPEELLGFLDDEEHLREAFYIAACTAGQENRAATVNELNTKLFFPASQAKRDISQPKFIHEFYAQFFNSIWAILAPVGGGAARVTKLLQEELDAETVELLNAPPPKPKTQAAAPEPAAAHEVHHPTASVKNIPVEELVTVNSAIAPSNSAGAE
ncbi:MAG: hypothetical protein HYR96_02055 [Deltaproteobacteria bacterium]|nr:hypothetical protein [Deltaproteobacteria bacterium]MBI3295654.1 hypothetical protein [Deltaproteobacteria bacterium]